jgi:hypothetical protein
MAMEELEPVTVEPPKSREQLLAELRRVGAECDAYWNRLPEREFLAPLGPAWSPADNVRHLLKSSRPVALALRLPRFLLRLLFGRASRPSRPFEQLRADYRAALAAGAGAGPFAPRPQPAPVDPEGWRAGLMRRRARAWADLVAQAERWNEADLEACRLPHPLLGKLTVREMLLFTLYHEVHHVGNVARRTAGA